MSETTQVSEQQQQEQKKKKRPLKTLFTKEEWLQKVIDEVRGILRGIEENIFDKYRLIGDIILKSGYVKGQWNSYHKELFMKDLKVDRSTFSLFIRLGEMDEAKFAETKETYGSIREWYTQGKPKGMSDARKKLIQGLIARFPGMVRDIKEILRTKNSYLTEKELTEFNTLVSRSNESPIEVFIKNYYLVQDSTSKLPAWLLIGFEEYIEKKGLPENTSAEAVIRRTLSEILKAEGINKEVISTRAKLKLRTE